MKYLVHFIHLHEISIIKAQGILWIRMQKHYKVQWIQVLATAWIYQFNLKLRLNETKKKIQKEKRKTMESLMERLMINAYFFAFWHTTSFYSIWKCSLCDGDFEISRRFLLKMLHGGIASVQEYDPWIESSKMSNMHTVSSENKHSFWNCFSK